MQTAVILESIEVRRARRERIRIAEVRKSAAEPMVHKTVELECDVLFIKKGPKKDRVVRTFGHTFQ